MGSRLDLQTLLEAKLGSDKVYFQPPPSVSLSYPAIVYGLSDIPAKFADNQPFALFTTYKLTVIYTDPDSLLPATIAGLPRCSFDRAFIADGLNHAVFTITF